MTRTDGFLRASVATRTLLAAAYVMIAGCSRNPAPGAGQPQAHGQPAAPIQNARPQTRAKIAATLTEQLGREFPDTVRPLNGVVPLYDDSLVGGTATVIRTEMPLAVLEKRIDVTTPADEWGGFSVVLKVRALGAQRQDIIGWVKSTDVIISQNDFPSEFSTLTGYIKFSYNEPSGQYVPVQCLWLKTSQRVQTINGHCEHWFSPDARHCMAIGMDCGRQTVIHGRDGVLKFKSDQGYTSPVWDGGRVLVRGMYDDDAVYSVDLKSGAHALFYKVPEQYSKHQPDYGSGDGYYAYPAPVIDPKAKTVSIRFNRHQYDEKTNIPNYRTYLLATTDMKGKLIKIENKTDPE